MRIPTDIPLEKYIRSLIAKNRIIQFYKSDDWLELKQEVLDEFHSECQECLKHGIVTTKDLHVHHVNEVKIRPDLALSKYYRDKEGKKQRNLVPLCRTHHNEVHDRCGNSEKRKEKFKNTERW